MKRLTFGVLLALGIAAVASAQTSFEDALRAKRTGQVKPPTEVRFYVFTAAPPTEGLIPADYQDRMDSVKDVTNSLVRRLCRVVTNRTQGEVLVAISGRTLVSKDDDIYDVRATVTVLGGRVEIIGHVEDGNWTDAAGDLVTKLLKLVKVNEQRILATRK